MIALCLAPPARPCPASLLACLALLCPLLVHAQRCGTGAPSAVTPVLEYHSSPYGHVFKPLVCPSDIVVIPYIASYGVTNGAIRAVDGPTGALLWDVPLPTYIDVFANTPMLSLSAFLVVPAPPGLYVLDVHTGAMLFNTTTPCGALGGSVLAVSPDQTVALNACMRNGGTYAVNFTTGAVLWSVTQYLQVRNILWTPAAVVILGNCQGSQAACGVSALDPATGAQLWNVTLPLAPSVYFMSHGFLFMGVYATGATSIGCYNPVTGELLWSAPVSATLYNTQYSDSMLFTCLGDSLYGYDLSQGGKQAWASPGGGAFPLGVSAPLGVLIAATSIFPGIYVMGLAQDSGKMMWNRSAPLLPVATNIMPTIIDGCGNFVANPYANGNLGPNLTCVSALTGDIAWSYQMQASSRDIQPRYEVGLVSGPGYVYITFDQSVFGFASPA